MDGEGAGVHDVGVDHGGADVVAGFEEVGGEGVAEDVGRDAFGDVGAFGGLAHGFLYDAGVEMVAAADAGAGIGGDAGGGEAPLPGPFVGGVGVFAGEGVGQVDGAVSGFQVFLMKDTHLAQVFLQGGLNGFGKDGDAVFGAFAVADDNLVLGEVDVFHAQAEAFVEAEAGAVEDLDDEEGDAGELVQDALDFCTGEDDGEALGLFGHDRADRLLDGLFQDMVVEKEDGAEGLVLGGGGDVFVDREMSEESLDILDAQVFGMDVLAPAFFMKEDEAFDPGDVALLGAVGVVHAAEGEAELVEKFGWFWDAGHEI